MKKENEIALIAACDSNEAVETREAKKSLSKYLSEWLQIDFTIKIFGQTIIEWHYPPLNKRS